MQTSSLRRPNRPASGMTLLEVIVALALAAIVITATLYAISMMSAASDANHEALIAMNAARQKLAELQNATFSSAFTQFGPSSASNTFSVSALHNGRGVFVFPVNASGNLDETVTDTQLGMPQDLNGNGVATDTNVSATYKLLPVRIRITWSSPLGNREINLNTSLVQQK